MINELQRQLEAAVEVNRGMCSGSVRSIASLTGGENADDKIMKSHFKEINDVVRKFVAEREITVQEAALDATRRPLVRYSRQCLRVCACRPSETMHIVKDSATRAQLRRSAGALSFEQMVYDPWVKKYVNRT